jgi:D-alanyl-D-alanine carboxypeptidase
MRAFLTLIAWLPCLLSSAAIASDRYAAFVADMDSGEVLHARQADAERFPASLTKLMTLYLVFEALENGEIELSTPMQASAEAASRPPSRLGLAEGETITVEQAIRALIVQSANDVAVVVAEHLAANEQRFAREMTMKAFQLGLTDTRFVNASGLPAARQVTTARDIARLAHALKRDFEDYMHYFEETRFTWKDQTHHTHNSLVGTLDGVDGLKTGYIRASGFNIAVTVNREDTRLIAVVMGGVSPSVRDGHTRDLINAGYAALSAREETANLASLDVPRLNPLREHRLMTAELRGQLAPDAMGSAEGMAPVQVVVEEPSVHLERTWAIQVGAYVNAIAAQARLETVETFVQDATSFRAEKHVSPVSRSNQQLWRARFTGLNADQARELCAGLASRGEDCMAIEPGA